MFMLCGNGIWENPLTLYLECIIEKVKMSILFNDSQTGMMNGWTNLSVKLTHCVINALYVELCDTSLIFAYIRTESKDRLRDFCLMCNLYLFSGNNKCYCQFVLKFLNINCNAYIKHCRNKHKITICNARIWPAYILHVYCPLRSVCYYALLLKRAQMQT